MAAAPIALIELYQIAQPTRREHKWTELSEPIGGYVLVKTDRRGGFRGQSAPLFGRNDERSVGRMRQEVIARLLRAMRQAGLDALVAISPENFAYVTGFLSPTQPLMRWRHAMAVVTADGRKALVSVDMEASTIRAKAPAGTEIAVWREFKFDAMEVLADLLRKHGLAAARIGIETDYLPAGDFAALRDLMPQACFVPAQRSWRRLRQVKTPAEIEILRRLSRIADKAITDAYRSVGAGSTRDGHCCGAHARRLRSRAPNISSS